MNVLGIESSCDDTALAIVQKGGSVLYSQVLSQVEIHKKFGGVIPEIAAREHLQLFLNLFSDFQKKNLSFDAIAVTQGPGLIGPLLVGSCFAKGLALSLKKNLIPLHHLRSHFFSIFLDQQIEIKFPCLTLIASGGHTHLYVLNNFWDWNLIGQTLDDASGECFDKTAKMMGLPYPGGPYIEELAKQGQADKSIDLPKVLMQESSHLNLSFSGLKTAVLYLLKKHPNPKEEFKKNLCFALQEEIFRQITHRLELSVKKFPEIQSIAVAGGVSANMRFRELMDKKFKNIPFYFPQRKYCSDNAAMVAAHGIFYAQDHSLSNSYAWDAFPSGVL